MAALDSGSRSGFFGCKDLRPASYPAKAFLFDNVAMLCHQPASLGYHLLILSREIAFALSNAGEICSEDAELCLKPLSGLGPLI